MVLTSIICDQTRFMTWLNGRFGIYIPLVVYNTQTGSSFELICYLCNQQIVLLNISLYFLI